MFIDRPTEPQIATVEVHGLALRFRCESSYERYRLCTYAEKEAETLLWIDRHFARNDVFYDVGANIGVYTVYAASRVRGGQVFAFEPSAHSCAALLENVGLNGLSNVAVYCLPLTEKRKLGFLSLTRLEAGSSMHSFDRADLPAAFGERIVARQGNLGMPLDELVEDGLPTPNLLKIDVDGTELDILEGGRRTLESAPLRSILVEINWVAEPPGTEKDLRLLKDCGFELTRRGAISRRGGMVWRNLLFERS